MCITAAPCAGGSGSFRVNGRSRASAEAVAFAEAYAETLAEAEACGGCTAAATFLGERVEEVLLEAVAEAEVSLAASAGAPLELRFETFVVEVVEGVATAVARVRPPRRCMLPAAVFDHAKNNASCSTANHSVVTQSQSGLCAVQREFASCFASPAGCPRCHMYMCPPCRIK